MMRIISGKHRGRQIETIKTKGLRPTMGVAREAMFNILAHANFTNYSQDLLDGCRVLDLFCGCGAFGLEALSRGAEHVVFIDINKEHLDIARKNVSSLNEESRCTFIRADSSLAPSAQMSCNLIFIDPPYRKGLVKPSLTHITQQGWLTDDAVIVIETEAKENVELPDIFQEYDTRKYSNSRIRILQRTP